MTDPTIIANLARKTGITISLAFLVGLQAVPAADLQTDSSDGTDHAKVSKVVMRDPFWPVGYTPKWIIEKNAESQNKAVENEGSTDWNKAMERVEIQGVSSRAGNEFYAVINGQIKSAGETVSVMVGSVNYTWMIEDISPPSSVKLRRVSALVNEGF